jgi:hypothetical protein
LHHGRNPTLDIHIVRPIRLFRQCALGGGHQIEFQRVRPSHSRRCSIERRAALGF